MRKGAALIGGRGRGETELLFGKGADDGGEIRCLAAETGVLARGSWSELCGRAEWRRVLLILEYVESMLFGLTTLLVDLVATGCWYKELALLDGGAGDAGFGIGKRRRLMGGGAAESIGGEGAGGSIIDCSVCLEISGDKGFSFCFEARWSRNKKGGAGWDGSL